MLRSAPCRSALCRSPLRRSLLAAWLVLPGCARSPSYLHPSGYAGDREAALGWIMLITAAVVVVVVTVLVVVGARRGGGRGGRAVERPGEGLRWIYIGGIGLPTLILLVMFVLTLTTLSAVATPTAKPALTVEVTGHRWWWEVRYPGRSPAEITVAANEIHIPLGRPVRFELVSADIIHSFWVPELAGKTDLIPGQRNVMWLEADSAGTYWGQCAEYCGLQHAHMQLYVVAEPPADFSRWLERQRAPARTPQDPAAAAGQAVFTRSACAACHAIRGTGAAGAFGPDLTHLASRRRIAAGLLPNTRGSLAGWIANPQALKPGNDMPVVGLEARELQAVVAYLGSLQ